MAELDRILRAPIRARGRTYHDFRVGEVFNHHWGRTITEADNLTFVSATLQVNPLFFNREYARANGHPDIVVAPMLVFAVSFGLSVEDLSERGGAFLGVDQLEFCAHLYIGQTLTARSTVVDLRESRTDARHGIATWHTECFNERNSRVAHFKRTNMVIKSADTL